jgi:ketosteroid isomerase-like protein
MLEQKELTPGRVFFNEQLEYLGAGAVDALIDEHYTEDALLISGELVIRGRDALKAHFRTYLQSLGQLKVDSLDTFKETPDCIYFEATVTTAIGQARLFDAWVLREGKISYHVTGVK